MQLIYEDQQLLIINKPAGVLSIVDGYDSSIPFLRTILEPDFDRLWVVHRLDKETSGVMILARSPEAHKHLNQQFTSHNIHKEYTALVSGISPVKFTVNTPLLVNGDRHHRTVVNESKGKPASTDFELRESYPTKSSLVSVFPHTGYSHQIRAHLLNFGLPLLGDVLYSTTESRSLSDRLGIHRVALHAKVISFTHPQTQESMSFTAPFPDDFLEMISNCQNKNEHQSS